MRSLLLSEKVSSLWLFVDFLRSRLLVYIYTLLLAYAVVGIVVRFTDMFDAQTLIKRVENGGAFSSTTDDDEGRNLRSEKSRIPSAKAREAAAAAGGSGRNVKKSAPKSGSKSAGLSCEEKLALLEAPAVVARSGE
jgi:hypothetical protein